MIITIDDWLKENPEYLKGAGGGGILSSRGRIIMTIENLPTIILNPIIYKYWYETYYGDMDLYSFLSTIQDADLGVGPDGEGDSLHYSIIEELSELGVNTQGVGAGEMSRDIFEYIQGRESIRQREHFGDWPTRMPEFFISINPYLKQLFERESIEDAISFNHFDILDTFTLYINYFWMPPNMFMISMEDPLKRYDYINWINDDPFEVKS
tara:strand:- start:1899 stop:2528 length:630 start_codon:yes stop_codon:yes gene_type:complete